MENADLTLAVLETFKDLQRALISLEHCLKNDESNGLSAWFRPPENLLLSPSLSIRGQAYAFIKQVEYLDTQKPREILVGAGLIQGSEATLDAILALNSSKDNFKKAMLALKNANIRHWQIEIDHHFESLLEKRPENIAISLRKVGLSRLHLKQCYRRIPVFFECPVKVSWTWANTRAITRITSDKAKQLLLKQGNDYPIDIQLKKLAALDSKEPLAIVQELAPHLRANVVLSRDNDQERRVMVKGPTPIFYLGNEGDSFPIIRPPGLKQGKNKARATRSDVKLEPEPYLPSIRVHRYSDTN